MRKILHLNNWMYIKHVTTVLAVQIDFWGRKDFFRKKNVQPLILTTIEIRLIENVLNDDYNELYESVLR